jgi:hypothetical protein
MTEIFSADQARAVGSHEFNVDAKGTPCSSFFGTIVIDQLPQLSSPGLLIEYFDEKFDKRRVCSLRDGERMPRRVDEKDRDERVLARLEVEESRAPHLHD